MTIHFLITLLVLLLVCGVVYMIVDAIWPGNAAFKRIAMAVLALIILLYVLQAMGLWTDGRVFR